MAEGARLESVLGETPRGFKSRILRSVNLVRWASPSFPQLAEDDSRGDDPPEPPDVGYADKCGST